MEIVGSSCVPTSGSGERGATARHFARAFFGNLVVLLMIVAATCIATARPAQAQTASGYLGWLDQVSGTYHSSAYEACKAQWVASNMSNGSSRFIGALDTDVDFIKRCSWTSFQYICGDEGLPYCGTVLPANVSLKCSSGWTTTPAGICVQTAFDVPELPCDKCDIVNHGATLNPSVGDPIGLHTGAVARSDIDFLTHDGRFQIKRHFRSKVIGNNIAAFSSAKGLDGFWALDLMPELHLGSLYGGTLSSPSAKMAFVKPNGVGVSFKLRNDSGVNSWGLDNGYYYALRV